MNVIESKTRLLSIKDNGRYIQAKRSDGLDVFLDRTNDPLSLWLNKIRRNGTRRTVFYAVGIARGLAIAQNYAAKYGTAEEQEEIQKEIQYLASMNLHDFEENEQRRII